MAVKQNSAHPEPLRKTGAIDKFAFEETTPVIGREYPDLNIVDDILNSDKADELIRDLAITSVPPRKAFKLSNSNSLQFPNEA
jgi:hypothetical protein